MRSALYAASGSDPPETINGVNAVYALMGTAQDAASLSSLGAAFNNISDPGTSGSGSSLADSRPRSTAHRDVAADALVRSIFSAHCLSSAETIVVHLPVTSSSPDACKAAMAPGSASIAASRTQEPTSPRLSVQ